MTGIIVDRNMIQINLYDMTYKIVVCCRKLHKPKWTFFDYSPCSVFDQSLPEDISHPESWAPEAAVHDARLYILELERGKVSHGCLWKLTELLISDRLLYRTILKHMVYHWHEKPPKKQQTYWR